MEAVEIGEKRIRFKVALQLKAPQLWAIFNDLKKNRHDFKNIKVNLLKILMKLFQITDNKKAPSRSCNPPPYRLNEVNFLKLIVERDEAPGGRSSSSFSKGSFTRPLFFLFFSCKLKK